MPGIDYFFVETVRMTQWLLNSGYPDLSDRPYIIHFQLFTFRRFASEIYFLLFAPPSTKVKAVVKNRFFEY